jgi:hypothetical protein
MLGKSAKGFTDEPPGSGPNAYGFEAYHGAGASERVTVREEGCVFWSSDGVVRRQQERPLTGWSLARLVPAHSHMPRISPPGWHVRQKFVMRRLALTEETDVPQRGQGLPSRMWTEKKSRGLR